MRHPKKLVSRLFLLGQIVVFAVYYVFGHQGLLDVKCLECENHALERDIVYLRREIALLEEEIFQWNSDAFFKEKVAREQLQMARANDHVIYFEDSPEKLLNAQAHPCASQQRRA